MIRIEDVQALPEFMLTDLSKFERLAVPEEYADFIVKKSFPAKIFIEGDRTVLVAGIFQQSFLGSRHFWALVSEELRHAAVSSLRALREYGDEVLPGSTTYIKDADLAAVRLATFFGFESTNTFANFETHVYEVYRRPL